MSNRLDSLNTKKPSTKPSLRFKPKVVERKSKEEREKNVKVKQEEAEKDKKPTKPIRGQRPNRGRGGRNQYANTHVLSSGLLSSESSGSAGFGKENKIVTSGPSSTGPGFLQNLKLKDKLSSSDSDDDDDDLKKIDMAKEYKFAEEETVLFPVRPERFKQEVKKPSKEPSPVKDEPEFIRESSVKSETPDTQLQRILDTKADLESKITQTLDLLTEEEREKYSEDQNKILSVINGKFSDPDGKFTLIQLPKLLPEYTLQKSLVKQEPELIEDTPTPTETTENSSEQEQVTGGQIGQLNFHKSGKITINLGNDINMDLKAGVPSTFLQELILLELHEPESKPVVKKEDDMELDEDNDKDITRGTISKLGDVDRKFIATPII